MMKSNNSGAMADLIIKSHRDLPPLDDTPIPFSIEKNTYNSINYEDFFNNHMRKNVPCLIKNIGTHWESSKKWANNNEIQFDYLTNQYGTLTVPVTDCKNLVSDYQPKSDMKFSDYISYWRSSVRDKILYLKDWHLRRCKPDDKFYVVPKLFGSDWLNEYAQDKQQDDFMFVYMGPTGTWTPMHVDVYNSFSWSVNVAGRKKWYLFPPGEEKKLQEQLEFVAIRYEPKTYEEKNVTYYEIIQERGDAIFVPSGWYHQVENEKDTISINHNWINGCNIVNAWNAFTKVLDSVRNEIINLKDAPEYPAMCQTMMKKLYGIDCEGFAKILTHIGEKRFAQLNIGPNKAFNFTLSKEHCLFDLKSIAAVVDLMTKDQTYVNKEYKVAENFLVMQDCLKRLP